MVSNEVVGLSEQLVALADLCLELPMRGVKQSHTLAKGLRGAGG